MSFWLGPRFTFTALAPWLILAGASSALSRWWGEPLPAAWWIWEDATLLFGTIAVCSLVAASRLRFWIVRTGVVGSFFVAPVFALLAFAIGTLFVEVAMPLNRIASAIRTGVDPDLVDLLLRAALAAPFVLADRFLPTLPVALPAAWIFVLALRSAARADDAAEMRPPASATAIPREA